MASTHLPYCQAFNKMIVIPIKVWIYFYMNYTPAGYNAIDLSGCVYFYREKITARIFVSSAHRKIQVMLREGLT